MSKVASTIEDGYESYVDDELGYSYDAWDNLSVSEIRVHDEVLLSTSGELDTIDPAGLNDLGRWALARAYRQHGNLEKFLGLCAALVDSAKPNLDINTFPADGSHPALDYADISQFYIDSLARAGHGERAQAALSVFRERWPDHAILAAQLEGRIHLYAGDSEQALRVFEQLVAQWPEDAELRFEIAEDIATFAATEAAGSDATDLALHWLTKAEVVAQTVQDRATLVDIELLRSHLQDTTE